MGNELVMTALRGVKTQVEEILTERIKEKDEEYKKKPKKKDKKN